MTYEYRCLSCETSFDVLKSVAEIDRAESCPSCQGATARQFVPSKIYFSGTKVTHAEYNPAFGCVVNNKRHKDRLCKEKGMVEIGNDFGSGEKMQAHFEGEQKRKREKAWEDL